MASTNELWQKCPVCNGFGHILIPSITIRPCHACDGQGLISIISGRPPNKVVAQSSTTELVNQVKITHNDKKTD